MATIILGVTGGIAAYKSVTVLRTLVKAGHEVWVTPTAAALEMVGAPTFAALSQHRVESEIFPANTGQVEHIERARHADLIIIAPATADTIARLRAGRADDALTATVLAATCPVLICPAMHTAMWEHPATRDNLATLESWGYHILAPDVGALSSGDSGAGRLPEPETIVRHALQLLAHHRTPGTTSVPEDAPLAGIRLAISAGGTREALDPVRYIGNRSSGKQGVELALAAAAAGAEVDLVAANIAAEVLAPTEAFVHTITITEVETAEQLSAQMHRLAADCQVIIMCAAVSDYRPLTRAEHKLKKTGETLVIELTENPDILRALVAQRREGQVIVGFAAETGDDSADALTHGIAKAQRKGADLLVINDVSQGQGFARDDNAVVIVRPDGSQVAQAHGSKSHTADAVIAAVIDTLEGARVQG